MIVADIILATVSLVALIFATVVDIRIKEVPDWISYSLIISGVIIRLFHSIIFNDWFYLLYGLLGLSVTFLIGTILYRTNQWGGGDAKLLMGLGTTLATKPFFTPESNMPFISIIIIYIAITGAFYGIVWSIALIIKNRKNFITEFKSALKTGKIHIFQTTSLGISLVLIILVFFLDSRTLKTFTLGIALIAALYFYLYVAVKSIENVSFYKRIPIEKLVEGDWLAADVRVKNKTILSKKTTIEKKHIIELKALNVRNVLIKEGIPFVPPFLLGTILAILIGNPFF